MILMEKGEKNMCELLDKYLEAERAEYIAQGRAEIIMHMVGIGKTSAEISQLTGIPEAEVNQIISQKG